MCLIALGSFALVGLQVAGPDMRTTGMRYFEQMNLADISIIGDYGIDEENQSAINRITGAEKIEYGYMKDVVLKGTTTSFRIFSKTDELSAYELLKGRLPEAENEIAIAGFYQDEYVIGDTIAFDEKEDVSGNLVLKNHSFKIVGFVHSGELLSHVNLGPSTAGTGALKGYAVVTPSTFDSEVYMITRISFEDTRGVDPYSDEYVQLLQNHKEELRTLLNDQPTKRLLAIKSDYQKEIDKGWEELAASKQELADAEVKLSDARRELDDARVEISDAEKKIAEAQIELDDAEAELVDASNALEDGRKQLEDGRTKLVEKMDELSEAEEKISEAEKELAKNRALLREKQQEYDEGAAQLADAKKEIADAEKKIAAAQLELDNAQIELNKAPAALEAGRKELEDGRAELAKKTEELEAAEKEITAGEKELAANETLLKEKQRQYDEAAAGLNRARQAFSFAKSQFDAAKNEIDQAEERLENQKSQYEASIQELEQNKADLEARLNDPGLSEEEKAEYTRQLTEVSGELSQTKADYQAFLSGEYASGMAKVEEDRRRLSDQQALLDMAENEITALESALSEAKVQLDNGYAQFAQAEAKLNGAKAQVEEGRRQIKAAQKNLEEGERLLEKKEKEYIAGIAAFQNGRAELAEKKYELQLAKIELKSHETTLSNAKTLLEDGRNQLAEAEKELAAAKEELEDGRKQIDEAKETLAENEQLLAEKEIEYADGVAKFESARAELAEKKQELADGKKEFAEKENEYQEALSEFEKEKPKAERDIASAERELIDAQADMEALEVPVYALDTRREIPGSEGYRIYSSISTIVDALAGVFPIFLYLVAALVTLTTMTRFVDEERINSGTLKALGYRDTDVIKKFVVYGMVSSMVGALIGIVAGHTLLPVIVYNAYRSGFTLPQIELHFYPEITVIALLLALASAVAPAYIVAVNELRAKPSVLLQPKPPASGSKILLERIRPLWSRMSFTHKVTARNIFRYKKRMLMTVFGVCGAVTLLFAGLSVQHSIAGMNDRQFGEILRYDMIVAKKGFLLEKQSDAIEQMLNSDAVERHIPVRYEEMTKVAGDNQDKQTIQMIIPDYNEAFKPYIRLTNRSTGKELELRDDGVIISERIAKLLDVKPGDSITLTDSKDREWEVTVADIAEMYIGHFAFMNQEYYQTVFGESYSPNAEMVRLRDSTEDNANARANDFMQLDGVVGVAQNTTMKSQIDSIVDALDQIMNVLILVAALLAMVILYNLTNINVSERIRELSTIKVLGFHSNEVTMYIYRETIVLTLLGILAGFAGGYVFYLHILDVVPPEEVMFNPALGTLAFIMPVLTVGIITVVLGTVINRKLKNVDMLEALKSVE